MKTIMTVCHVYDKEQNYVSFEQLAPKESQPITFLRKVMPDYAWFCHFLWGPWLFGFFLSVIFLFWVKLGVLFHLSYLFLLMLYYNIETFWLIEKTNWKKLPRSSHISFDYWIGLYARVMNSLSFGLSKKTPFFLRWKIGLHWIKVATLSLDD